MITKFDKATVRMIATEIEAALQSIAKKHNVDIRRKGGTFTDNDFTMKLAITTIGNDGTVNLREVEDLKKLGVVYGLPADSYGKTFKLRGQVFTIVALKTKNHEYPVIAERSDGKRFKFPVDDVVRLLNR